MCVDKSPLSWNDENIEYKNECGGTDWLKPSSGYAWTLTPVYNYSYLSFFVENSGLIGNNGVIHDGFVWPTLYLKSSVKILPNSKQNQEYGSVDNPFILAN